MIAKLKGKIEELKPTELVLDVNGVGYFLQIPFTTFEKIQFEEEVSLWVYTLHKEDQFKLFGFKDIKDRSVFEILLGVSGIGPSMALSLLSGISIDSLIESVKNNDINKLIKIPGIGKSKAEKLIFELNRKIKKLENYALCEVKIENFSSDAIEAMVTLGFDEKKSTLVIEAILKENPKFTIEVLIKEALKEMNR